MPTEAAATLPEGLDHKKLLEELEVPFPPEQVKWRVTNTTTDRKRGQIVAYADPRAYTDRLNALFSPLGWTREYKIETMNNITRVKKGVSIVTGKVLVTCTVTIIGLGSHSGTGEEWADDDNGMTSADAQAFKRACSCFGLGRYFYDVIAPWVDLDHNRQPLKTPTLPASAIPENWRKGMRPTAGNDNTSGNGSSQRTVKNNANSNRRNDCSKAKGNGNGNAAFSDDLDTRILGMERVVGTGLYRNILREFGRANQPKLIRDSSNKRKVLQVLESAARGLGRLSAITKRLDPDTIQTLLTKLQAPRLAEIADMKTLQDVVFGLEDLAGPNHHHAA
jgi:hypothetical protein